MTRETGKQRTATSPLFVLKPRLTYMHCRYLLRTQRTPQSAMGLSIRLMALRQAFAFASPRAS